MKASLRYNIFSLLDFLSGSRIQKHYNSLKNINEDHGSAFSISERERFLSQILQHCLDTVPLYRNLGITDLKLELFPVTNKNLIKEDPPSFRSDAYLKKRTIEATTSGSTGTPFTVLHDMDKKRRRMAAVRYFGEVVGHDMGNMFFYLKVWNEKNRKGKLTQIIENIITVDVFKIDDQFTGEFLKRIKNTKSRKSILAYSSSLDLFVKYLDRKPMDMKNAGVVSIIAMAESLEEQTKLGLIKHFGCPVVSRYANIENGILAQQTPEFNNDFMLNLASYHIELLDMDEDIPAKEGETGRIVVTDLFNKAMPMIRYDTGDLGVLGKTEKDGKTHYVLKKMEGRRMDVIFNTKGDAISSYVIPVSMWNYTELVQYQFVQLGPKEYEFRLNAKGEFKREQELIQEYKGYLGKDADISVIYVEEIPLLSSGKRKKVMSLLEV